SRTREALTRRRRGAHAETRGRREKDEKEGIYPQMGRRWNTDGRKVNQDVKFLICVPSASHLWINFLFHPCFIRVSSVASFLSHPWPASLAARSPPPAPAASAPAPTPPPSPPRSS